MTETLTIDIPEKVADAISDAAKAAGVSREAFVLEAAAARALDLLDAKAFFAERAKNGRVEDLLNVLNRKGGQPPHPEDARGRFDPYGLEISSRVSGAEVAAAGMVAKPVFGAGSAAATRA
ncbi:MAG TPA: DUF1778 domain-containing protein [Hyphomonadaceae bacterium]|jgi:uncharacterized protein (DUF1778 family)|nr:DUF1778 domain-containing protein [Hyphomonadaceae bacterium]